MGATSNHQSEWAQWYDGIPLLAGRAYAFEMASFPGPTATATTCSSARGPGKNSYRDDASGRTGQRGRSW
jgi:hypothetical protein